MVLFRDIRVGQTLYRPVPGKINLFQKVKVECIDRTPPIILAVTCRRDGEQVQDIYHSDSMLATWHTNKSYRKLQQELKRAAAPKFKENKRDSGIRRMLASIEHTPGPKLNEKSLKKAVAGLLDCAKEHHAKQGSDLVSSVTKAACHVCHQLTYLRQTSPDAPICLDCYTDKLRQELCGAVKVEPASRVFAVQQLKLVADSEVLRDDVRNGASIALKVLEKQSKPKAKATPRETILALSEADKRNHGWRCEGDYVSATVIRFPNLDGSGWTMRCKAPAQHRVKDRSGIWLMLCNTCLAAYKERLRLDRALDTD